MWLTLAFTSAALLGFYDVAKKKSLTGNAVLPVLLLNTLFSSLVFLPALLSAECGLGWFEGTVLEASPGTLHAHGLVVLKSVIVLTSWIFGYFGMKHLPITIVGPINATRPVMVLVGAMLVFGERLNACQWAGVLLALVSLFMLSRSSRREGSISRTTSGYSASPWPPSWVPSAGCTTNISWRASTRSSCKAGTTFTNSS